MIENICRCHEDATQEWDGQIRALQRQKYDACISAFKNLPVQVATKMRIALYASKVAARQENDTQVIRQQ